MKHESGFKSISNMAHGLRTLMNAIMGFSQTPNLDSNLSNEQKYDVREDPEAGNHMLELLNYAIAKSRIESSYVNILVPVELRPLVDECLGMATVLADKRNIQLSHNVLDGVVVRSNPVQLKQILLKLLSNTIKYNCDGGVIKLDVKPEGVERLRIRVTDTGPGIPSERLTELFQPFNRLNAENSGIEGTGIGLILTRRLAELMGGTVDVQSEVGVGSTFWIELPVEPLAESCMAMNMNRMCG